MPGMDAGAMTRKIRIERAVEVDDGLQTRPGSWDLLAEAWASYTPAPGAERFELRGKRAQVPVTFGVYWQSALADLSTIDRVVYDGRIYEIAGTNEIGSREGIEIHTLGGDLA